MIYSRSDNHRRTHFRDEAKNTWKICMSSNPGVNCTTHR
jgi:hypothetical protein